MIILAIETSCDETSAALVQNGVHEICSVTSSSAKLHEKTGGVVPEVAARKQLEFIVPVLQELLEKSRLTKDDIDAIAVTIGPGLIGSLIVGVEAAKSLSLSWEKPLIPVNHLVGHIYGNFVDNTNLEKITFPALVLIVSGGHTDLVLMKEHCQLQYIGGTLDDACGEAYDKTARLLGISDYLGGAKLSELARKITKSKYYGTLPRPKIHDKDYDFSFSGLKTAVRRLVEKNEIPQQDIAFDFEKSVVEVLTKKTFNAAQEYNVKCILLGGGVSANLSLREAFDKQSTDEGLQVFYPPLRLCGDNAIYIASAAFFNQNFAKLSEVEADPSLGIV